MTSTMIAPTETLVKYENPTLVSKNIDKKTKVMKESQKFIKPTHSLYVSSQPKTPKSDKHPGTIAATGSGGPLPGLPRTKPSPADAQKNQQTEEILNSILPPREWSEDSQLWKQCVSSTPATRLDVLNLQVYTCTPLNRHSP